MNFRTEKLNRRRMIGMVGAAGAAAATGGLLLGQQQQAAAAGTGTYLVLQYLQILDEPTDEGVVVGELAAGDYVTGATANPEIINGMREIVTTDDVTGWVLDEGLESQGGPIPEFPSARYMAHEDNLYVKPHGETLMWVPFGKLVMASTTMEGDYIFVQVQDENLVYHQGWLLSWYLTPEGTQMLSVNNFDSPDGSAPMLTDPDPEAEVVTTVPGNSSVLDYDDEVINGFRGVQWYEAVGWISQDHLGRG